MIQLGLAFIVGAPAGLGAPCDELVELTALEGGPEILANGILVTGRDFYPTKVVRANLNLTRDTIGPMLGKNVLLVAEGYSGLLPYLLRYQNLVKPGDKSNIRALDVWYGDTPLPQTEVGLLMRNYRQDYKPHLVRGDATEMPIAANSVDFIVSHKLVNNFETPAPLLKFMEEVLRVLKSGGEARIYGFGGGQRYAVERFLAEQKTPPASVEFTEVQTNWLFRRQMPVAEDEFLMVMRK